MADGRAREDTKNLNDIKAGQAPRPQAESGTFTRIGRPAGAGAPVRRHAFGKKAGRRPHRAAGKTNGAGKGAGAGVSGWLARLKRPRVAAVCGLTAALLITVLLFACLVPGQDVVDSSLPGSGSASTEAPALPGIDLEADDLPAPETYVDTVLPETKDAGMSYVKETLFLGDSNTQRMLYYSDVTGASLNNCVGVVGMGITSFESLKCVSFVGRSGMVTMVDAAKELQPRRIVITFGTNNLGMNVNSFIASYKKALEALAEACPYTDIIIGAVFPVDKYCENGSITVDMVDKFNAALAALADAEGHKFLNWHEPLRDEKTGHCQLDYTVIDGIHLSREGMKEIIGYMRTHSYITEDERPARKGSEPQVAGVMPSVITQDPYKPEGPYSRASSASSSSLPTSSVAQQVAVVYSTYDTVNNKAGGGTVTVNGQTGASLSFALALGGTVPAAAATPAEGFEFVGWSCSIAGISAPGAGFALPADIAAGSTVTVTALFKPTGGGSSSSSSTSTSTSDSGSPSGTGGTPSGSDSPSGTGETPSDTGSGSPSGTGETPSGGDSPGEGDTSPVETTGD